MIALSVVLTAAPSRAAEPTDPYGYWSIRALGFVTINPLLVAGVVGGYYRHVIHPTGSLLLKGTYVQGGLEAVVNPATPALRIGVDWLPVQLLQIKADYGPLFSTGAPLGPGHGLTFPSVTSPFDEDTLRARKGEERDVVAHRFTATVTLRAKISRLILLNDAEVAGWYVPGARNTWFYNTFHDALIQKGVVDGTVTLQSTAAVQVWEGQGGARALVGVLNQYTRSFRSEQERDRIALVGIYTPVGRGWGIDRPTFVVAPGMILLDQNRKYGFWMQIVILLHWDFIARPAAGASGGKG